MILNLKTDYENEKVNDVGRYSSGICFLSIE